MKLLPNLSHARRQAGILLIECVVYIAVFALLLGIGTAAFYFCWDHSKALIYATDDITAALRAGEGWRADVRGATGKISIETNATSVILRIPKAENRIIYRLENGELRREIPGRQTSRLLLAKVKNSEMKADDRSGVRAWYWELELTQRRKETYLPLRFTFAAAQPQP